MNTCPHIVGIRTATPSALGFEGRLKLAEAWARLSLRRTCIRASRPLMREPAAARLKRTRARSRKGGALSLSKHPSCVEVATARK